MPKVEKPSTNAKWERINTIYNLIKHSAEGLSIKELSSKMDVSTKTIQRDLYEVLQAYGAIKVGHLWKIDVKAEDDHLNANERIILGILDEMAKNAGHSFYGKAHSLLAKVTQQLDHPIFANIESETLDEQHITLFSHLENAIKKKTIVMFEYKGHSFEVKPLKLAFFDGFWYLLAQDSLYNDKFKKFHLKSISNLSVGTHIFQLNEVLEERLKKVNSVWFDLDSTPFDVRLLVDKEIATYFKRKPLKGQTIEGEDSDGSIEIVVPITHEMEILPLIFWYIPHIKVLEPQSIADMVKERMNTYCESLGI